MSNFYVVYNIGSEIPGSDAYSNTYEIYESEAEFLSALGSYIEYAKSCLCDVDEIDEAELAQWYEDNCYDKEGYEVYLKLIAEKAYNPACDNSLYQEKFCCFDVEIEIILATKDYKKFIDTIFDDFCKRSGVDNESDQDDLAEAYEEYPILKYVMEIQKSSNYPNEKAFLSKFNDLEDSINEGANSFNV